MARYIEVGGCAVPTAYEMPLAIRYVMKRTGATPSSIARTDTPEVRRILNAHGKHTQVQLVNATPAQRAAWA